MVLDSPRRTARATQALALLLLPMLGAPTLNAQEDDTARPKAPIDLPDALKAKPKDPAPLASDGQPASAGRVPDGTPADAAELWRKVTSSLSVDGATDGPVATEAPRAFELEFEVRDRSETGARNFVARFAYLDVGPGLVRGTVLDDKRAERSSQMRGFDQGKSLHYWYRKLKGNGATDGWIRLSGRDNKEGRDEIDSWAAISFDIARLTRPQSFRIVSLLERRRVDVPEDGDGETKTETRKGAQPTPLLLEGDPGLWIPGTDVQGVRGGRDTSLAELCEGLRWLELTTPDFRLFRDVRPSSGDDGPPVVRLVFGIDPETWRPQVVLVSPNRTGPLLMPGTVLVQCTDWFEHGKEGDRSWLPGRFFP
ncbi:MAG: hypothetical protein AAGI22_08410 [Planctomycetota bacterium]